MTLATGAGAQTADANHSPSTDRTIQISGHMLRQSVMGCDLSYEDMMNDKPLLEQYNAVVSGEEMLDGRRCRVIDRMIPEHIFNKASLH